VIPKWPVYLHKRVSLFSQRVVRPERHPAVRLDPGAAEQHPRHGRFEIVIADLLNRHATEPVEGVDVAFQERLLPLRQRRAVRRAAGERQPHREQRGLGLDPAHDHPQIVEVDLGLRRRRMGLRHEALLQRLAGLRGNLGATFAHMVTHRRVRQIPRAVLVDQASKYPPRGVPLLLRGVQIAAQHLVDEAFERLQPRRAPLRRPPRRRDRTRQRLPHRAPMHVMPVGQLADRALLDPRVASDRGEQLHPRPHPPTPFRDHRSVR